MLWSETSNYIGMTEVWGDREITLEYESGMGMVELGQG